MNTLNKLRENTKSVIWLVVMFLVYLLFKLIWPSAASVMKWGFLIILAFILIKKFLPQIKKLFSGITRKLKRRKSKGDLESNFGGKRKETKDTEELEWK